MKWLLRFQLTITKSNSWIINEQTVYRNLKRPQTSPPQLFILDETLTPLSLFYFPTQCLSFHLLEKWNTFFAVVIPYGIYH